MWIFFVVPRAYSCAVCFSGTEETRVAFYLATAMMTYTSYRHSSFFSIMVTQTS